MFDATDVANWSGLDFNIWKAIERQGVEVELIGSLSHGRSVRRRLKKLYAHKVERRTFSHFWNVETAIGFATDVARRLEGSGADVVVGPNPIPLAFVRTKLPIVLWADATFAGLLDFYPEFSSSRLSKCSIRAGKAIDKCVLRNVALAVFSSEWAAQEARSSHPSSVGKIKVIPYGANMASGYTENEVVLWARRRFDSRLKLLFVGVDWDRKGGRHAVSVVEHLRKKGFDASLTIVGCNPEIDVRSRQWVDTRGFVSKRTSEGQAELAELFRTSHFLLLPTRAECCAVVLSEAAAYGLPAVANDVGGTRTVVEDGVSGLLFDADAGADEWAASIAKNVRDPESYLKMSASAFKRHRDRLNWEVAGRSMVSEFEGLLRHHGGESNRARTIGSCVPVQI
jgi:glycosyltransferase involved in cell wall biosynthesis